MMSDFFRQIFTPVSKFWIIPNPSWLSHYPTRCSVLSRRVSVDRGIAEFEETNFKQVFVTFYSELVLVRGLREKKSVFIKNIPLEEKVGSYLSFDFSWWAMVGILSSDQIRPPTRPWCTCQTPITSPNLTINQYCRHAPRDPSSPQFPKDWIVTISTPLILHNSNSKVFPNILGLWQVAQTISYGKLWQDLALWAGGFPPRKDFLPGKISWSFCGPQVKIKDSEYAKKCGIGGDCYFYVSKVTLFSSKKTILGWERTLLII